MAPKVTSSSNRSKRQAQSNATVRSSAGRRNRQSSSTATVTNASQRQSNGTARVTSASDRATQKQLPASGQSTAGSVKARGQRLATAVGQKVQRDVAATRALADMMQRNVDRNSRAQSIREGSRMTSGNTRYVPPGGENAKGQGALPPGQRGGDMRQKGGPLAQRQSSAMTQRSGGSNARTNSQQRSNQRSGPRPGGYTVVDESPKLPPGRQRGPVRPSIGKVSGPASNPKRPTTPATARASAAATPGNSQSTQQILSDINRNLNNSRRIVNEMIDIIDKEVGSKPKPIKPSTRGTIATAVTGALGEAAVRPLARAAGQKLGEALRPVGRAIDNAMPGMNSKDERNRKTNTPYQTQFPQARANAQTRVNRIKAGIPDAAPQTPQPAQRTSTPPIASSGGGGYQGVSGRISPGVRGTSPMGSSTPMQGVAASESYRDGGKGLYQGSEAYRAAMKAKDPNSSGNPLLDRMRSTMASANYASQRQDEATGTARVNPYAKGLDLAGNTKPIAPIMGQLPGAPKINPYATGLQLAPAAKPAKQSDTQIAAKPKKDERKPRATTSRPTRSR